MSDANTVCVVSAFFVEGSYSYRTYEIGHLIDQSALEALVVRAHGKANLSRRSYSISKAMARAIDSAIGGVITWDFNRFYYQIGKFRKQIETLPDNYFLARRSMKDGSLIAYYPLAADVDRLRCLLPASSRHCYEEVFVDPSIEREVLGLFPDCKADFKEEYFLEIVPILKKHYSFYAEKFGIRVDN